jgi:branched-subunit amino acid aminotransferase/4-amino-4-deoxychorismate lyase
MPFLFTENLAKACPHWKTAFPMQPQEWQAMFLGFSVFTTFRSDLAYCWQRAHFKRLHEHGKEIGLAMTGFRAFSHELDTILETLIPPDSTPQRVRITLFPMAYTPAQSPPFQPACVVDVHPPLPPLPSTLAPATIRLKTHLYQGFCPHLKQGSQLPALRMHHERGDGVDAVLWENQAGELTESTHANVVFHHRQWGWATPPQADTLAGVTLQQIRKSSEGNGFRLVEHPLPVTALPEIEALFLVNSIQGIRAVEGVNAHGVSHTFNTPPAVWEASQALYTAWQASAFGESNSCYGEGLKQS